MKYALISVANKNRVEEMAHLLWSKGYVILSTGGTYEYLLGHAKIPALLARISEFTNADELLNGRVKTLHPKVYAGILANRRPEETIMELIDVIVVNLYPFKETISREDHTEEEAIENIDIGGVSLLRAGAKNYKHVLTVVDPNDYFIIKRNWDTIDSSVRRYYAGKTFEYVTKYDMAISEYYNKNLVHRSYEKVDDLKYGCNPHQTGSVYKQNKTGSFPFKVLNGSMGYINYLDAILSWQLVSELSAALGTVCCASFKHNAPAGVGTGRQISKQLRKAYMIDNGQKLSDEGCAYIRARQTDPMSSFGDFVAMSTIVDEDVAKLIKKEVSDGIIAPGYTEKALELLMTKKRGQYIIVQAVETDPSDAMVSASLMEYRELYDIVLGQSRNIGDCSRLCPEQIVTQNKNAEPHNMDDLVIASVAAKYTPSNSVVFAYDGQVIGVGSGQQNRVDCVRLAASKAETWFLRQHPACTALMLKPELKRQNRVNAIVSYIRTQRFSEHELAHWTNNFIDQPSPLTADMKNEFMDNVRGVAVSSDGFFPFRDSIDECSKYGVSFIVQPGGSVADADVTHACDQYGMVMFCSGLRLFSH